MNIIGTVIRSIIYKIPLKLLLILVAVFGVLFACFSSAGFQSSDFSKLVWWNYPNGTKTYTVPSDYNTFCFFAPSNYCIVTSVGGITVNETIPTETAVCYVGLGAENRSISYNCSNTVNYMWLYMFNYNEQYNSLQCQTEYNLIPISSVDSAYCEDNNLCTCSDCPGSDLTPGVSNIFINDVFHPGAYNIIMNIPEEIDRDYTYTNSGSNFNLDVVGYNQDEEYIQSVIDVQNYKPTSDDFTRVFSNISNFGALLIACLFVILVFYMIKKVFK